MKTYTVILALFALLVALRVAILRSPVVSGTRVKLLDVMRMYITDPLAVIANLFVPVPAPGREVRAKGKEMFEEEWNEDRLTIGVSTAMGSARGLRLQVVRQRAEFGATPLLY